MEVYVVFMVSDHDDVAEILTVTQYYHEAVRFLCGSGFIKVPEGNWRYDTMNPTDKAQAYIERQKIQVFDETVFEKPVVKTTVEVFINTKQESE